MNGRTCECTDDAHAHDGTCGQQGYSWSAEHNDSVLCKSCYDDFIKRKATANDLIKSLLQIPASKLDEAKATVAKILGGNK